MPPLHEDTIVKIKLSQVVGAAVGVIVCVGIFLGGWMWQLQDDVYDIKKDVAVIKAVIAPTSEGVAAR